MGTPLSLLTALKTALVNKLDTLIKNDTYGLYKSLLDDVNKQTSSWGLMNTVSGWEAKNSSFKSTTKVITDLVKTTVDPYKKQLNDALKTAFPGFIGSISNYANVGSYYNYLDKNAGISTNTIAEHMSLTDEALKNYADANGWDPVVPVDRPVGVQDARGTVDEGRQDGVDPVPAGQRDGEVLPGWSTSQPDKDTNPGWTTSEVADMYENIAGQRQADYMFDDTTTKANDGNWNANRLRGYLANQAEAAQIDVNGDGHKSADRVPEEWNGVKYAQTDKEFLQNIYKMITAKPGDSGQELSSKDYNAVITAYGEIQRPSSYASVFNFLKNKAIENGHLAAGTSETPKPGASDTPAASGTSGNGTSSTGSSSSTSNPVRKFRLIRGDGSPAGADQLRNNGNAVFLVSSSNELFHVTEQLAKDMVSDGSWYEPEVLPQDQVNGMTLRTSLNHTSELGVLIIPSNGEYFLVRGTGTRMGESQLAGNGDAVYAIDRNGNRYHVTAAVASQMQQAGTWMEPAILDQGTVDGTPLRGALASAGGGVTDLSITVGDPTVVRVVGTDVKVQGTTFRLVRGNGPGLGNTQLKGNGAAVYAVFDNGNKLHVTAAMAEKLVAEGKWVEPTLMDQTELDKTPPTGVLANVSGDSRPLEIKFIAPAPVAAPTPAPVVAPAPVVPKVNNNFKLVRGNGSNLGRTRLHGNGAAVYAYFEDGRKLYVTGAMANDLRNARKWSEPEVWDQATVDSKQITGAMASVDGARSDNYGGIPYEAKFELVRGNGPGLGESYLRGNGAAVYAVYANGTKLHVTAAMAEQLKANGLWLEPTVVAQDQLDASTVAGTMADLNGTAGALVIQMEPPQQPTPVPSVAQMRLETPAAPEPVVAPAAPPAPVIEMLTDRTGVQRPKDGLSQEVLNHVGNGGTFQELDTVAAIYASGDPTAIDNWERFSKTRKYSVDTPWGAEYQKVIDGGYGHDLAVAWTRGKYPGMF